MANDSGTGDSDANVVAVDLCCDIQACVCFNIPVKTRILTELRHDIVINTAEPPSCEFEVSDLAAPTHGVQHFRIRFEKCTPSAVQVISLACTPK